MTSKAIVTCRDGKQRVFEERDISFVLFSDDVEMGILSLQFKGKGIIGSPTICSIYADGIARTDYALQPVRIEAETPNGKWVWEKVE